MPVKPEQQSKPGSRYLPLAVPIGVSLAVLGGAILFATLHLRTSSREQITGQHAKILYALWLNQKMDEETEAALGLGDDPSDQLPTVLQTARLRQLLPLLGIRLFDSSGKFVYADANVSESGLRNQDLVELRKLHPVGRLREGADLSEVSVFLSPGELITGAILEVCVPLHSAGREHLAGVAQFLLDGTEVAAEFRTLDRNLAFQATLTFAVGGGLLVVVLGSSFLQLQRFNRLLSERTQSLLRANQELALAAKTSAVGAVTAHLIHGLRNPLSGLQSFVASRSSGTEPAMESEWQMAISSTRRMQAMINEIVRVLREEDTGTQYELSVPELSAMLAAKVQPLVKEAGVLFRPEVAADGTLRNREANLINLILYNLVQNAIQATPSGKAVTLKFGQLAEKRVVCEVRDEGPGIPEAVRQGLFKPCRSSKEGGSGIGLAISKQLANCIGAELELKESSSSGSVFVLVFEVESGLADADTREVAQVVESAGFPGANLKPGRNG